MMVRLLSKEEIKDIGLNVVTEHLSKQEFIIVAISVKGEYYLVRIEKGDQACLVVVYTTSYPNRGEDHEVSDIQYYRNLAESNGLLLKYAGVSLIDIDTMSGILTNESSIMVDFKSLVDLS